MIIKPKILITLGAVITLIWLSPILLEGHQLKPFTSDGCSAFPDGTFSQPSLWSECCFKHDIAYWKGGSFAEKVAADNALAQCVSRTGSPKTAWLMLKGVKMGGSAYLPTSFRWGYGWQYLRAYKALSSDEKIQIQKQLKKQRQAMALF